jgi:hypothetical protein
MDINSAKYNVIQKADTNLEKAITSEDWSEANTKGGYLNGLVHCRSSKNKSHANQLLKWANWNYEGSVEGHDYGKAAYWRAYINGFDVMMYIKKYK